jgi:flagellar motility protein MotE (MotC chaperone)
MRNILILAGSAVVLFALSAGLSLYLASLKQPGNEQAKKEEPEKEKPKKPRNRTDGDAEPVAGEPPSKSAEEAAALLARLRQRAADLQRREEDLRKQEQRLKIIGDDVRGERAVIDQLRKRLSDELGKLDQKAQGVEKRTRDLEEQKKAAADLLAKMEKRKISLDKDEGKNLQHLAVIADSMPPAKAAGILKQLADSGQMDVAVKLLGQMRERRAAAVLAEMTDVALAAQFVEKVRGLQRSPSAQSSGQSP